MWRVDRALSEMPSAARAIYPVSLSRQPHAVADADPDSNTMYEAAIVATVGMGKIDVFSALLQAMCIVPTAKTVDFVL